MLTLDIPVPVPWLLITGLVPLVPRDTGHQGAREPGEAHSPSDSGFFSWVVSALPPASATPEGKTPCLDPLLQLQIPRFSAPMSPRGPPPYTPHPLPPSPHGPFLRSPLRVLRAPLLSPRPQPRSGHGSDWVPSSQPPHHVASHKLGPRHSLALQPSLAPHYLVPVLSVLLPLPCLLH